MASTISSKGVSSSAMGMQRTRQKKEVNDWYDAKRLYGLRKPTGLQLPHLTRKQII